MPKITPNLWFDTQAMAAAKFYVGLFPNAEISNLRYYGEPGSRPRGASGGSAS
jgi:predicted 3-demethylubiquinone-9 3-methyltransferase (glyoxalase superfamily)